MYFWVWEYSEVAVPFAYASTIPIGISILRAVKVSRGQQNVPAYGDNWYYTGQHSRPRYMGEPSDEVLQLRKRVERLEREARARPPSTTETSAQWTTPSGAATLNHHPSVMSHETHYVPSYTKT